MKLVNDCLRAFFPGAPAEAAEAAPRPTGAGKTVRNASSIINGFKLIDARDPRQVDGFFQQLLADRRAADLQK